jgi:hypothetical protein
VGGLLPKWAVIQQQQQQKEIFAFPVFTVILLSVYPKVPQ